MAMTVPYSVVVFVAIDPGLLYEREERPRVEDRVSGVSFL